MSGDKERKERQEGSGAIPMLARIWNAVEKYVPVLMIIAMSVITFMQVFYRYVLAASLPWAEEVGRFLVIAITFMGSAYAFREGTHVSVEAFTNLLPDKLAFGVHIFSRLASIAFFLVLFIFGTRYALDNIYHLAPATRISMAIPYMTVPVGSVMIIVRLVILTVEELRRGKIEEDQEESVVESY